jgi:hypothetical protein
MERVAFLVEETGERIECLLNPETIEVKRSSGIRDQRGSRHRLVGSSQADDPLHFTGGGRTEAQLDLLFDTELVGSSQQPVDVRALTRPLWMLSENSTEQDGRVRPPLVRLVWGKGWNVPGIIASIAERFDRFTDAGLPRRSWLRLLFLRVADDAVQAQEQFDVDLADAQAQLVPASMPSGTEPPLAIDDASSPAASVIAIGSGPATDDSSGVRFDLLAGEALGSPFLWRLMAAHNRIDNPHLVDPGTVLTIPTVALSTSGKASP